MSTFTANVQFMSEAEIFFLVSYVRFVSYLLRIFLSVQLFSVSCSLEFETDRSQSEETQ